MMRNYKINASLLSADFARLGEDTHAVLAAGVDAIHLDVMDNHFVPNLTVGPLVCKSLRQYGIIADINVHLMAKPIDNLIVDFAKAGATSIIFHREAVENVVKTIDYVHQNNCRVGIALKPETELNSIDEILEKIDLILIMTVQPGFAGQKFMPQMLAKIMSLKKRIAERKLAVQLAIDGGIKINNIGEVASAGGDTFVVGSAIFDEDHYEKVVTNMR